MVYHPRVIVKFVDSLILPYASDDAIKNYLLQNPIIPWQQLTQQFPGITIRRLFKSVPPAALQQLELQAEMFDPNYHAPKLGNYFAIYCPTKAIARSLANSLQNNNYVESAYVESKPAPSPCVVTGTNPSLPMQHYLDPAPVGIDARYAWTMRGGCGEGEVRLIDIEYSWDIDHEDIRDAHVQFLWGDNKETFNRDHGTSVLGIILMQDNDLGGVGIANKMSHVEVVSRTTPTGDDSIPDAFVKALSSGLIAGDILLLEIQLFNGNIGNGFLLPCETDGTIFRLIQMAKALGIIVVEAAGNGNNSVGFNLDNFANETGKKALDRTSQDFQDSGAIMVGAGSPRVNKLKIHSRNKWSNYGNRIDCYAWGSEVYTADDPLKANPPYTNLFGGTSSASAIIAAAIGVVQSIAVAAGLPRLSPAKFVDILKNPAMGTGSVGNKIGFMPDLKRIISVLVPAVPG